MLQTLQDRVCVVCGCHENKGTDYSGPMEEKGRYRYSLKMRVLRPLLSRGEHPDPCLDRLLLPFLGLIIYYIECCCLRFRYNQGNENNNCRRERWRADYALCPWESLYRLWKLPWRQAINIYCFRPGQGSFSKSKPKQSGCIFWAWFPRENRSEGLAPARHFAPVGFPMQGWATVAIAKQTGSLHFGSQADTQSTEPYQPGQFKYI